MPSKGQPPAGSLCPTFRAYYAADSQPDSIRLSPILAGESGALIDLLAAGLCIGGAAAPL